MTDMLSPAMTGQGLSDRVAEEIRALLGRRRMPQAELARRLGVSGPWLNYRLTGKQPIDLNDLDRIAQVLGVSPADLLAATGTPTIRERTSRHRDRRGAHTVTPVPAKTRPGFSRASSGRPPSHPTGARRPVLLNRRAA